MLLCDMVDVPVELVVGIDGCTHDDVVAYCRRSLNINIVASQLVKLLVMVVIVNLYTITRLNITDMQYRWMRENRDTGE
jgi:hypothetical protein